MRPRPQPPKLPEQFVCEAPTFVLKYIQDVMAWGHEGWDRALGVGADYASRMEDLQEADKRIADLESALEALYALVKGESPQLLEDDHHDSLVRSALHLD